MTGYDSDSSYDRASTVRGAPLFPKDESPKGTQATGEDSPVSIPPPSSEESRLINASNSFDRQIAPMENQPPIPQSIAPTTYRYGGGGVAFPTNHSASSSRAVSRYHRDSLSGPTSAFAGLSPWPTSDVRRLPGEDESVYSARLIASRIHMCTQFINRAGILPESASRHAAMVAEIGQHINSTTTQLRLERDGFKRECQEKREELERALHAQDGAKAEILQIQQELRRSLDVEKTLHDELAGTKSRIIGLQREAAEMEDMMRKFQKHHKNMKEEWTSADDEKEKIIKALQEQVKKQRVRNAELAKKAGEEETDSESSEIDFAQTAASRPESEADVLPAHERKPLDEKTKNDLLEVINRTNRASMPYQARVSSDDEDSAIPTVWNVKPTKSTQQKLGWKSEEKGPHVSSEAGPSAWTAKPTESHKSKAAAQETGEGSSGWMALTRRGDLKGKGVERRPQSAAPPKQALILTKGKAPGPSKFPRHKDHWELPEITVGVEHMTSLTKGYIVNCHSKAWEETNIPDHMLEIQEPSTWNYLLNLVYANQIEAKGHMKFLLSTVAHRPYVIMRIVLDFLFKKIISPQVFLGFRPEVDSHLLALQNEIRSFSQAPKHSKFRERQSVVNEHARIITDMFRNKANEVDLQKFKKHTIEHNAQMLSLLLQPLRPKSVSDEQAFKAVRIMVDAT
ncbi:uncharacterized protein F4822DRAFT_238796 [Hypoxylon trugodes]|uniref:uncharacterized protein n=1 Tax=Hypoxylon trugodes TaxID=326681 RepID=UPI00218DB712|nr:uncharacterized protein F4822DRAFT_238796 [Hypoxylon trugodes]KAI1388216.1 hypothetical protein F4822DRAFT_238796 [Hypoxylon trugodes]